MSNVFKAAPITEKEIDVLKEKCNFLKSKNILPTLKIVLVGEDPASVVYTNNKKKYSEKIGIDCEIIKLAENVSSEEFCKIIEKLNHSEKTHGIIIQLPLPTQLRSLKIETMIHPTKDVDGMHYKNLIKLFNGAVGKNELIPCTPKGIVTLLKYYGVEINGKKVVIIGRGPTVGKPLSLLMTNLNATVTLCHSRTQNIPEITKNADIIVAAIGKAKFVNRSFLSESGQQVLIDVGINSDENGKLCGDIDFEDVKDHVAGITPVPGGIGPMTILSLAQNLITAAEFLTKEK